MWFVLTNRLIIVLAFGRKLVRISSCVTYFATCRRCDTGAEGCMSWFSYFSYGVWPLTFLNFRIRCSVFHRKYEKFQVFLKIICKTLIFLRRMIYISISVCWRQRTVGAGHLKCINQYVYKYTNFSVWPKFEAGCDRVDVTGLCVCMNYAPKQLIPIIRVLPYQIKITHFVK